jgi:hypothetical protein
MQYHLLVSLLLGSPNQRREWTQSRSSWTKSGKKSTYQCSGSLTLIRVADPYRCIPDTDPDPVLFFSGFQGVNKNDFFCYGLFCFLKGS